MTMLLLRHQMDDLPLPSGKPNQNRYKQVDILQVNEK
jgi:hypothetical protein